MTVPLPLPTVPSPDIEDNPTIRNTAADIAIQFALSQIGKPYRWGATGPDAYDCSGLMLVSWQHAGVTLPRTALMQSREGAAVASIDVALPGDLIFPYVTETHVAMYLGNGQVVEAPTEGVPVHVVKFYGSAGGIRRIDSNGGTPVGDISGGATKDTGKDSAIQKVLTVLKALSTPGDWASIGFILLGGILLGLVGWTLISQEI